MPEIILREFFPFRVDIHSEQFVGIQAEYFRWSKPDSGVFPGVLTESEKNKGRKCNILSKVYGVGQS